MACDQATRNFQHINRPTNAQTQSPLENNYRHVLLNGWNFRVPPFWRGGYADVNNRNNCDDSLIFRWQSLVATRTINTFYSTTLCIRQSTFPFMVELIDSKHHNTSSSRKFTIIVHGLASDRKRKDWSGLKKNAPTNPTHSADFTLNDTQIMRSSVRPLKASHCTITRKFFSTSTLSSFFFCCFCCYSCCLQRDQIQKP